MLSVPTRRGEMAVDDLHGPEDISFVTFRFEIRFEIRVLGRQTGHALQGGLESLKGVCAAKKLRCTSEACIALCKTSR